LEQEPNTPRERAEVLIRMLVPDWRPTPQHVVRAIRIVLLFVLVLGILTLVGRPFDITLWQWLDLLIIPAVLAVGGYLFTRSENRAAQLVAEQRTMDEALQNYLDQMGEMLLDKDRPLRDIPMVNGEWERDEAVCLVARAHTLTVLPRLDGPRKGSVLRFLYESGLIGFSVTAKGLDGVLHTTEYPRILDISDADLRRARLTFGKLTSADLSNVKLNRAILTWTNLEGAILVDTDLRGERDDPRGGDLRGTNLKRANLHRTKLDRVNLLTARLSGAKGVTNWDLEHKAADLRGATMPNGQKYEDWLKSREEGDSGS
jgi:hypothetical protein